jgi:hypothetical protein
MEYTVGQWNNEYKMVGPHDNECMWTDTDGIISGEFTFLITGIPLDANITGLEGAYEYNVQDQDDLIAIEVRDSLGIWHRKDTLPMISTGGACPDAQPGLVGHPTDDWNGTWTPEHMMSQELRVRFTFDAVGSKGNWVAMDFFELTVYYSTEPITTTTTTNTTTTTPPVTTCENVTITETVTPLPVTVTETVTLPPVTITTTPAMTNVTIVVENVLVPPVVSYP